MYKKKRLSHFTYSSEWVNQALYGRGRVSIHFNSFSVQPIPNVNRNHNWFANDSAFTLNRMDITTLSCSILKCLGENWLPKLIKLKVNRSQPCRMLFYATERWFEINVIQLFISVLLLEFVEADQIIIIELLFNNASGNIRSVMIYSIQLNVISGVEKRSRRLSWGLLAQASASSFETVVLHEYFFSAQSILCLFLYSFRIFFFTLYFLHCAWLCFENDYFFFTLLSVGENK